MTNLKTEGVRLVEQLLKGNPDPQKADWKRLMDNHPEHAAEIADAALQRRIAHSADNDSADALDGALYDATISTVLSMVHKTPSAPLLQAQEKIASVQGPKVRKVAEEVGIGPYVSLLNGVLSGRTTAPMRIVAALAKQLDLSSAAFLEAVRRNFAALEVPAFKSPAGKPQVGASPIRWEDAVRALDLSKDETQRLLKMGDRG